jgi:hypothetical protein
VVMVIKKLSKNIETKKNHLTSKRRLTFKLFGSRLGSTPPGVGTGHEVAMG